MITSVEKLKDFIKLNNAPYWILYRDTNTSQKVSEVDHNNASLSIQESQARLDAVFAVVGGGRFVITAKTKANDIKAGVYKETVDIAESAAAINGFGHMQNPSAGYVSKEDVSLQIAQAKKEWDNEHKMEKLQQEITELKKPTVTEKAINGLVKAFEPVLTQWASKAMGMDLTGNPSVGVSGFNNANGSQEQTTMEQATPEEIERIQKALETLEIYLRPKGMTAADVLEKIAKATKEKPAMIDFALNSL